MTDKVLVTIAVEEVEGEFFYTLDDSKTQYGPFVTEEAAATAATTFLQSTFASFAKQTLFGDKK